MHHSTSKTIRNLESAVWRWIFQPTDIYWASIMCMALSWTLWKVLEKWITLEPFQTFMSINIISIIYIYIYKMKTKYYLVLQLQCLCVFGVQSFEILFPTSVWSVVELEECELWNWNFPLNQYSIFCNDHRGHEVTEQGNQFYRHLVQSVISTSLTWSW